MDNGHWLEACRKQGQLNEGDVKKWVTARTDQIRNSALLLSLSPALAIVAILCILGAFLVIALALKRRSVQLRHYALNLNQMFSDLVILSVVIYVGCWTELRDAFNSIGFLGFLICVFSFTNVGISQIFGTLINFFRLDCPSFYARIRIEYILTLCILLWFMCAIFALVFSPLFFVLEFAQLSSHQECMFYSCQSPLLLSFLLIMAIVWFANLISYALTLARLHKQLKKERDQQGDMSPVDSMLQIHWISIGPVALFSSVGVVILFIVAGLAKAIFEMHQLRVLHVQCQMTMRLDLIGQMQTLASALLVIWIIRAIFAPLSLIVADFKNLIAYPFAGKLIPIGKHQEPIKIHCCSIDKVSWCKTV